ncbi:LamG-like jellyroll fold domain-containing protein [Kribbella sp. NPDC051587]|uniref:LamG-like jellyroll fold domain-containing protein n=1 Tax=Kribbella sp. NPDC051587 TaxID=3364119 RepID=UPI0037BA9916
MGCALALVGGLLVGTASVPDASAATVLDEVGARGVAAKTGRQVEVATLTTETGQVVANPDGSFTRHESALPVRVRRPSGWVPVDMTLRAGAHGTVAPAAGPVDVAFSGGGETPLVRLREGGRELAVGWPGTLPQPVLAGDTATYREVFPGVDLVLTASTVGLSQILVVKNAAAAANPALGSLPYRLTTKGLAVHSTAAGLTATDAAGEVVFSGPAPYMWDSSGRGSAVQPGGRVTAVGARIVGDQLSLVPDRAMLTAKTTRYPVYIDPSWSGVKQAWTQVWSNYPNTSFFNGANLGTSEKVARVGYDGTDQKRTRSFFQFDTSGVKYKHILKATLQTFSNWSWSCTVREVQVWATNPISSATTWKNQPTWAYQMEKKSFAKGFSSSSCPAGGVEFNVTSQITNAAANGWSNVTQGLRASTTAESKNDSYSWRKFANNPSVTIDYNTIPDSPANLTTEGSASCVTGSDRLVVSTVTPTLRATLHDVDNSVQAHFEWWTADGTAPAGQYVSPVVAGATPTLVATSVPSGAFGNGVVGKWRVRAEDGIDVSEWSPWCEFAVDDAAPEAPTAVSSGFPDNGTGNAVMGTSLPVTFGANGESDVVRYEYTLNGTSTALNQTATPAQPGGEASIAVLPDRYVNWVHVRSVDAGGNRSAVVTAVFYAAQAPGPVADWPLDETGDGTVAVDSAPVKHNATLGGGTSWGDGRQGGALTLNGTTGYAATTAAVVNTLNSFSVSSWVRLTDTSHNAVVASQVGSQAGAFTLSYSSSSQRWIFSRTSADVASPTSVKAISTTVPAADGRWVHLTGVYDAPNTQIRLYVNGVLEATTAYTTPWNATGSFQIGRSKVNGTYGEYWPGDLDQLQVHNRVLLPGEIQQVARRDGQWLMDEASGTTAGDANGAHPASWSASGVSRVAGKTGNAVQLNGTTGVLTASGPAVRTDGSFTVAAWVKPSAVGKSEVVISQDGSQVSGFRLGYAWDDLYGGYRWSVAMPVADSASAEVHTAVGPFDEPVAGAWTHVAAVYDAKDQTLRLYVGGQFVAETYHRSAWHAAGASRFGAGWTSAAGLRDFFTGAIDDVQMYSGVLTDQQISDLYLPSQL